MNKMQLMMITNVPEIAKYIESCGVDRIFVDMEYLGKEERQKNLDLPQNRHTFGDVTEIKKVLSSGEVMLRINPLNKESKNEIEQAVDAGADCIMLPYFHTREEVESFVELVDGRAKTNILLETACAAGRADQILSVMGVDEVHFGLNDLKISLKHDFLFESFAGGLIDHLCTVAKKHGVSFGIGGVGRIGKELLPAELIVKEHIRLKSERVILSRVFHNNSQTVEELESFVNFEKAISDIREVEQTAAARTQDEQNEDSQNFKTAVAKVVTKIKESQAQ